MPPATCSRSTRPESGACRYRRHPTPHS
jgi:hypothetical protein